MPRPVRSVGRTAFAAGQLLLLGAALVGLGSLLEIVLGAVVVVLLLLVASAPQPPRPTHRTAGR